MLGCGWLLRFLSRRHDTHERVEFVESYCLSFAITISSLVGSSIIVNTVGITSLSGNYEHKFPIRYICPPCEVCTHRSGILSVRSYQRNAECRYD